MEGGQTKTRKPKVVLEPTEGLKGGVARRPADENQVLPGREPGCNRLIHEKSPYLLQHARNPVDWYPWGEEAFARARTEDKPIFLSVGYSTCHWCHVMERESFENEEVAAILNRDFIAIKVDREERPDVDRVYMTYVQATTGSGGWPMSVWLAPDLKPLFGGTYFPPENRWGRPGLKMILLRIAEAWKQDRRRLLEAGDDVLEQLRRLTSARTSEPQDPDGDTMDRAYAALKASYDPRYGGFGGPSKFPTPSVPNFLLRYHARSLRSGAPVQDALEMARVTLLKMADGGIHDHIGGGFHRYAVDERWHVPHFEKMLYDQGQLACTYLDAHQLTGDAFFAAVARDILDYVRRDMTSPEGAFYSAEDADSPLPDEPGRHAEGAFYVWTRREIEALLGEPAAEIFSFRYGVMEHGNVRHDPAGEFRGRNVLIVTHSIQETAVRFGESAARIVRALDDARNRLFDARRKRPRPHLDDKIVTAWNGLMISGFARAHRMLGDERDLAAARAATRLLRERLYRPSDGVLFRRYRDGDAAVEGYADDYAFLIQALLDLYEASFDAADLTWALQLQRAQDERFWDAGAGGYYSTSGRDETILLRIKDDADGAEPSTNSVAVLNLLRLAELTGNAELRTRAERTLAAFGGRLRQASHAMPQMLASLDFCLAGPGQIVTDPKAGARVCRNGVCRPPGSSAIRCPR